MTYLPAGPISGRRISHDLRRSSRRIGGLLGLAGLIAAGLSVIGPSPQAVAGPASAGPYPCATSTTTEYAQGTYRGRDRLGRQRPGRGRLPERQLRGQEHRPDLRLTACTTAAGPPG